MIDVRVLDIIIDDEGRERERDHSEPEVFEAMDADADRRLAFQEFCQGLSLLGMSSAGLSEFFKDDQRFISL